MSNYDHTKSNLFDAVGLTESRLEEVQVEFIALAKSVKTISEGWELVEKHDAFSTTEKMFLGHILMSGRSDEKD